jgi:hypothetical protein
VKNYHSEALSGAKSSVDSLTSQNGAARVVDQGLGIFAAGLEGHGVGVGRWRSGGVGVAPTRCASEVDQSGGDEEEKMVEVSRSCGAKGKEKGKGKGKGKGGAC